MYDDRTAVIYDALYAFDDGRVLRDGRAEAERILHEIEAAGPDGRSLLDVGCGTGRQLPHLGPDLRIRGLDINACFIEMARAARPDGTFDVAEMETFELTDRFDVITCLFSAIAYVRTVDRLRSSLERFKRHLAPGGLIIIEPWYTPELFRDGHVSFNVAEHEGVRIAWAHHQSREGSVSTLDIHYLIASGDRVENYTEQHELGLLSHSEYTDAMTDAGLQVSHDPEAFGRGLYVGVAPR